MTWAKNILDYHFNLKSDLALPNEVEWIYPFDGADTKQCMTTFYTKYFNDARQRTLLLGINPGRFGAGVTGVPFTDPNKLEQECGIENAFNKREELSSRFVYEFINALRGSAEFYKSFYITSMCPLGFTKNGKNYNYYDSKALQDCVMPTIIENLKKQISFGANRKIAFSMGKGKNFAVLEKVNKEHALFDKVVALPHPRWVMQYRLRYKQEFIDEYVSALNGSLQMT